MPELRLFHCPPACSRITMAALEETRLPYRDSVIDLMKGQQRTPEYLAVNVKGKVPALRVDHATITENPVIIEYLHGLAPQAGLLPRHEDAVQRSRSLADLVWASGTLHGSILRQVVVPFRMTDGDPSDLKKKGVALLTEQAESIAERLEAGGWWYGAEWSAMDLYVEWIFMTAQRVGGFELAKFPQLIAHGERVRAKPSFQRTLTREQESLARAGIAVPSGTAYAP